MKVRVGVVVALSMVLMSQPAWARRMPVHDAAESPDYGRKFGGMLGRGALNVLTSFVDIPVNIVHETQAGPPLVGTLTGIAKGVGCGVLRLGSGAVDLVTFWVPGFNGIPVSDSYENCLVSAPQAPAAQIQPAGATSVSPAAWDVPTSEPGAAQAPAPPPTPPEEPPRKRWTK